ncbi:MAG: ExbD/TolR family protein [Gammaproteobacteria bacterium]
MSSWRKRHRQETVELNITAFMNLMVILVPFLLITAVFSQVAILELNLPSSNDSPGADDPENMQLEVIVRPTALEVGERNRGLLTRLPNKDDEYDYEGLQDYLKRVKAKYPDKIDASILLEPDIPYDILVQVMDTVRVFEFVDAGAEVAKAELFPEISIGDAPVRTKKGS